MMRIPVRVVGTMLLGLVLSGCGESEKSAHVVLYSSIDEGYSREVARRFEEETGIAVRLVSDTEATKSTGLLNRLIAEQERPVADVFWSGDVMRAAVLEKRGLAEPYQPEGSDDLPARFSDPGHAFTGSAGRLRMILFHKGRAKDGGVLPESVVDLSKPEFAGRSCLANPLFGTTSMHAAVLFEVLGEERGQRFFEDFAAHGGRMLSSNGEVRRRVASGEFAFGLTDSDDISVALADGKPVGFIVPDQGPGQVGAVLIPSAAVLIRNAPHPAEARRLVDYLVSAESERFMAESVAAHFPLRPGLEAPEPFDIDLTEIRTVESDYQALATRIEHLQSGFLRDWVARQSH